MSTENHKRNDILEAVEKLAARKKLYEITLDEVAHHAKVGKGTIYRNFADKDDLFFQVAISGLAELCELIEEKIREDLPYRNKLLGICREINRFFVNRKQLFNFIQSETAKVLWANGQHYDKWFEQKQKLVQTFARVIEEGIEISEIRSDRSPEVLTMFLLGMLRTRGRDFRGSQEHVPSLEFMIDLFLNGAGIDGMLDE